jgi:hypothetical protein
MSSFLDIPIHEINFMVNKYKLTGDDKYLSVWNFIISNKGIPVTNSIANWIISYNNRIHLETLPDDILIRMFSKMDNETLLDICRVSKQLNNFCKHNFKTILGNYLNDKTGFNTNNFTLHDLQILNKKYLFGTKRIGSNLGGTFIVSNSGKIILASGIFSTTRNEKIYLPVPDGVTKILNSPKYIVYLNKGNVYILADKERFVIFDMKCLEQIHLEDNYLYKIKDIENIIDIEIRGNIILMVTDTGNIISFGDTNECSEVFSDTENIKALSEADNNVFIYGLSYDNKIYEIFNDEGFSFEETKHFDNILSIKDVWYKSKFAKVMLDVNTNVNLHHDNKIIPMMTDAIQIETFEDRLYVLNKNGDVYHFDEEHNNPVKLDVYKNIIYIGYGKDYSKKQIYFVDIFNNIYKNEKIDQELSNMLN